MAAQSKLDMILELKGKFETSLTKARKSIKKNVGSMQEKLKELKSGHIKAFSAIKDEVPGFARAITLMRNPYVLVTAAAISFFAIAGKVSNAAASFNKEFLNIRQLNLDKSTEQLEQYRQLVLDTAFDVGIGGNEAAKAFYDVQSGLGTFGQDTAKIVTQVGRFSVATGQELPDGINATVKSMKAFKLGANDVDMLLQSNAKTVQLGITTFGELAKVQSEYAGAAASAGQSVDTANKVFAVFTSISSNSATAATKAKTAFESLTAKNTTKAFKKIGVAAFDAQGGMRGLEDITKDLVPKLAKMSDQDFLKFRESIGGTEGLRDLLNQLRNDGTGVLETFQKFDNVNFDINKAIKNANGDFNTLKGIVGNRLNVVMIELGSVILPIIARGLNSVNNAIVWFRANSGAIQKTIMTLINTIRSIGSTLIDVGLILVIFKAKAVAAFIAIQYQSVAAFVAMRFHAITSFLAIQYQAVTTFVAYRGLAIMATLQSLTFAGALNAIKLGFMSIPIVGWIAAAIAGFILLYRHSSSFRANIDGIVNVMKQLMRLLEAAGMLISAVVSGDVGLVKAAKAFKGTWNSIDFGNSFQSGYDESMKKSKIAELQQEKEKDNLSAPTPNPTAAPPSADTTTTAGGGGGIDPSPTGPTQPNVRHVTVNIEALHKGNNIIQDSGSNGAMSMSEFEEKMEEVFLRFIRQLEYS